MKTFEQMFSDVIDHTNGTVVLDEAKFKSIQIDALKSCVALCSLGHLKTSGDISEAIGYRLWKLENNKE